jgi:hypothetical protein
MEIKKNNVGNLVTEIVDASSPFIAILRFSRGCQPAELRKDSNASTPFIPR